MRHLVMFDIDGTLLQTNDLDDQLYLQAMSEYLGTTIDADWTHYQHVTDSGIAQEIFEKNSRPQSDIVVVQRRFISLVTDLLMKEPNCCQQIPGAAEFIEKLRQIPEVTIGIATGGWGESARAKLQSAGIDLAGIAFASCDDALSRTEIMHICERRAASIAHVTQFQATTYFGDGIWDANAAATLGWNFIGIGEGSHAERLRTAGVKNIFANYFAMNISEMLRLIKVNR
jgi:FMN phosphatase YigB (HAD superfamily)